MATDQDWHGAEIAIVGMAGRFAGAADADALGRLLAEAPPSSGAAARRRFDPVDRFDAAFFRVGPRDAALMDPQHRHLLEVAWTALEHAGYDPARVPGPVGVFAGAGPSLYLPRHLLSNPALMEDLGLFYVRHAGNDHDFLTTRISYALDLKGPSLAVQTGRASALAAVHLACRSLNARECDVALAGGVHLALPGAESAPAGGVSRASGAGLLVLRRLEDARRDADTIHAVILGSAVHHGGASASDGAAAALREALSVAGVEPASIGVLDAATPLPLAAAGAPTRRWSSADVLGDLDTAAGAAALIAAVHSLRRGAAPAHRSPAIPTPDTGVEAACPWPAPGPRRAAVHVGVDGGTHAVAILQEAPPAPAAAPSRPWQLLVWSGRTETAAEALTQSLAAHFHEHAAAPLADAAYTLAVGRRAFEERRAVVAASPAEAAQVLRQRHAVRLAAGRASGPAPPVAFMFPGGGAQYPDMARELFEREPAFREPFERCLAELAAQGVDDLAATLFPATAAGAEHAAARLTDRAELSLPAIFSVGYALAQMLRAWGIRPDALIGHSLGEYVAACLAGVWSLSDALSIVVTRGRLFDRLPPGAMLTVAGSAKTLAPHLTDAVAVAAVNSPGHTVLSGAERAIAALEARLSGAGFEHRRLPIRVAAHSPALDPIVAEFDRALRGIAFRAPALRFVSNVTGAWITEAEATDPGYWVRHLRSTVRFADGVGTLLEQPRALVELGPGAQLATLVRQHPARSAAPVVLTTLRHARDSDSDRRTVLDAVGRLWSVGVDVDWAALHGGETRRRTPLPTYPFARDRHWIAPAGASGPAGAALVRPAEIEARIGRGRWVPVSPPDPDGAAPDAWLVLAGAAALGDAIARALRSAGRPVIVVRPGGDFGRLGPDEFAVRPDVLEDYQAVIAAAVDHRTGPLGIVHAWALDEAAGATATARFDAAQAVGFAAALRLLQALQQGAAAVDVRLWLVGAGFESVADEIVTRPDAATLRGLALVAPAESPGLQAGTLDVGVASGIAPAAAVVRELLAGRPSPRVALRGEIRFEHEIEMAVAAPAAAVSAPLRSGASVLLTGGLGGVALACARLLARDYRARLTLLSRRAAGGRASRIARELEALGAEVLVLSADVADPRSLGAAIEASRRRFGRIDAVFHAAGVLEPTLVPFLTPLDAHRAMVAKTHGALVLEEVLADDPPELLVLFSSISTLVGIAGQAAYAAANAFLNAWAHAATPPGQRRLAVKFGPWRSAGMTAGPADPGDDAVPVPDRRGPSHPLLGRRASGPANQTIFEGIYRAAQPWALAEHRLHDGPAVLPGAATFEIVSAALALEANRQDRAPCRLDDLAFVEPLAVPLDGALATQVTLAPIAGGFRYALESRAPGLAWHTHVTAEVRPLDTPPPVVDLARLRGRCTAARGLDSTAPLRHQAAAIAFGPRWQARLDIRFGQDEALAQIGVPAAAAGDLAYRWHPAVMDVAMTVGLPMAHADGPPLLWVPAGVERVELWSPPGARFLSYARLRRAESPARVAVFDVWLMDESGVMLARLTGLRLRGIDPARLTAARPAAPGRTAAADPVSALAREHGLAELEGVKALERVLTAAGAQAIVSSLDVEALRAHLDAGRAEPAADAASRVSRTDSLSVRYAAPRTDLERRLADVWARQLGLDRVGVHDDFFELGGESLVGLRLFAEIRRTFGVALPVDTLFAAPTVAALASRLQPAAEASEAAAAGPSAGGERQPPAGDGVLVAIQPQGARPPLYCVHDQNGYVLLYRDLAARLGDDQPFYGLQAAALDDPARLDRTVEAMAERYVRAVQQHQPHGPYLLSGSSLGGIVAFEMAQQLTRLGHEVALLALFDSWTPADLRRWWFGGSESMWRRARRHVRELVEHGPIGYVDARRSNRRAWQEYLRAAEAERSRHDRFAAEVHAHLEAGTAMPPETLTFHLEQLYGEAYRAYEVAPYPGRVTLFRAEERGNERDTHPTLGWDAVTLGGLEVIAVPGPHGFMVREPHVGALANALRERLEGVTDGPARPPAAQSAASRNSTTRRS